MVRPPLVHVLDAHAQLWGVNSPEPVRHHQDMVSHCIPSAPAAG